MSMYNRFAEDLSTELFDSVYGDLFKLAERQQKAIHATKGKMYVGEHQEKLNAFCKGKLSLGDALDYVTVYKESLK